MGTKMTPYAKAEAQRLKARKERAAELVRDINAARDRYAARGLHLKLIVDNDTWWLQTAEELSEDDAMAAYDDLHKMERGEGPEELACLLAIGLGIDAGRP